MLITNSFAVVVKQFLFGWLVWLSRYSWTTAFTILYTMSTTVLSTIIQLMQLWPVSTRTRSTKLNTVNATATILASTFGPFHRQATSQISANKQQTNNRNHYQNHHRYYRRRCHHPFLDNLLAPLALYCVTFAMLISSVCNTSINSSTSKNDSNIIIGLNQVAVINNAHSKPIARSTINPPVLPDVGKLFSCVCLCFLLCLTFSNFKKK